MPRKAGRLFKTAQKVSILRRHLVDRVALSDLTPSSDCCRTSSTTSPSTTMIRASIPPARTTRLGEPSV